jgi:hypothetical protein
MEAKVRLPASPPPAPQPPSTTKLGAAGERLLTAKEAAQFLRVSLSFWPIFYSWRGSTWHKSLILLGAGLAFSRKCSATFLDDLV